MFTKLVAGHGPTAWATASSQVDTVADVVAKVIYCCCICARRHDRLPQGDQSIIAEALFALDGSLDFGIIQHSLRRQPQQEDNSVTWFRLHLHHYIVAVYFHSLRCLRTRFRVDFGQFLL